MKRPAIVITMSLPNPAKASVTLNVFVRTNAITRRIATTSIGIRSRLNRIRATISNARTIAIGVVIQFRILAYRPCCFANFFGSFERINSYDCFT